MDHVVNNLAAINLPEFDSQWYMPDSCWRKLLRNLFCLEYLDFPISAEDTDII
jgi:hypothetical protein